MPKDVMLSKLKDIEDRLRPEWDALGIETDGFELYTRYFIFGDADQKGVSEEFLQATEEVYGEKAKMLGARALSDLSLFLAYGSSSSLNTGITRSPNLPGGVHQADEYIAVSYTHLPRSR